MVLHCLCVVAEVDSVPTPPIMTGLQSMVNPTKKHSRIARYFRDIAGITLHSQKDSDTHLATYNACPSSAPLQSVEIYDTHAVIIYDGDMKNIKYSDISRTFAYETEGGFLLKMTLQDSTEEIFFSRK